LESRLGGASQVLAAKAAFEEAGGLRDRWHEIHPPAITRWTAAAVDAVNAAYRAEQPLQPGLENIEQLNAAFIDVVATSRYAYTGQEWLRAFTAHFGTSDYCGSHQEALSAGRHWLAIAPGACPIAAADQETRNRCPRGHPAALAQDDEPAAPANPSPTRHALSAKPRFRPCI
jgi:hypothetical protein